MSLLAPRPQQIDRASVVLPTVTCSSCSAPIPLSSLGEHICRPAARATGSRAARPSQISIPSFVGASRQAISPALPRPSQHDSTISRNPSVNLPIPTRPSLSGLSPLVVPLPNGLYPSPSPSPRTPSPTNPFFPHPVQETAPQTQIVHGLGLNVGARREGPYPNDAPLTAVVPDLAMLDTANRSGAGMAGVGRRAFAAAAWGVRAGVALANSTHPQQQHLTQQHPLRQHPQALSQAQSTPTQQVQPTAQPDLNARSVLMAPPAQPPWQEALPRQMAREPPLLPKVPPSVHQRSGAQPPASEYIHSSHGSARPSLTQRSASAMGYPSPGPPSPLRQRSASAMSTRPVAAERRESADRINHSHTASQGEGTLSNRQPIGKLPFFERYKQMAASSSASITPYDSSSASSIRRESFDDQNEQLVASPVQTTFGLDDNYEEDQGSALPWATPLLAESPVIRHDLPPAGPSRLHNRHRTTESEASSSSSASSASRSGLLGLTTGPQTEEVVTPSQSWEGGLAERATALTRSRSEDLKRGISYDKSEENRDLLEQIGEEEEDPEEERVIFGANTHFTRRASDEAQMKGSISATTITTHDVHSRSRTVPVAGRSFSSSTSRKTCQKCGEVVGGANRFVERDGVVLCERDWKKLYLPSCRRCNLSIEKSAVSASDGQLKGKWHRACFTCTRCDKPFEGDSFYVHGGRPWCQYHYHEEK